MAISGKVYVVLTICGLLGLGFFNFQRTSDGSVSDSFETTTQHRALGKTKPAPSPPKHILVIVTDDQGFSDVGYRDTQFKTPTIDALAHDGVKLERFYTTATCTPGRAALMTGMFPNWLNLGEGALAIGDNRTIPTKYTFISETLRDMGYHTVAMGKWHLGAGHEFEMPLMKGFDKFFGTLEGEMDYYSYEIGILCNSGNPVTPDGYPSVWGTNCFVNNGYALLEDDAMALDYQNGGVYFTELLTQKTVEAIEAADPNTPLFLYYAPTAPHTPLHVPDHYQERYRVFRVEYNAFCLGHGLPLYIYVCVSSVCVLAYDLHSILSISVLMSICPIALPTGARRWTITIPPCSFRRAADLSAE